MRFILVLIVGILTISNGIALAEGIRTQPAIANAQCLGDSDPAHQLTVLQVSPMYLEIKEVLDQATLREKALLRHLAAAPEEVEVQLLVAQIEGLDLARDLDILNIQARYAHQAGRLGLEKQIRHRIQDLEASRMVAAR